VTANRVTNISTNDIERALTCTGASRVSPSAVDQQAPQRSKQPRRAT
jgi:hypothetical protein